MSASAASAKTTFSSTKTSIITDAIKSASPVGVAVIDKVCGDEQLAERVTEIQTLSSKFSGGSRQSRSGGARATHKHNGRHYKIRTGERGGKYILVDKKKHYL
jgi:hypothetical protein